MKRLRVLFCVQAIMSLTTGTRAGEIELNQDSGQRHRKDVGELKAGPNSQLGNGIRKSLSAVGGDYYLPPPRDIYTPGGTAEQRWQWGGCQCPPPRPFGGFDARPAIPGGTTGFDVQEFVSQQAPAINSVYNPPYRPVFPQSIPSSLGITSPGYFYETPLKRFDT